MSIIVALDSPVLENVITLADQLDPELCRVKIGKELFTAVGPESIKALQKRGFEIFLDLKFHDIPNTAAQAVLAAADLGVWMVNVHASGGRTMLETCIQRLRDQHYTTQLIAVTVLTSMQQSDLDEIGIQTDLTRQVLNLTRLAAECGIDGVVCSAAEARPIRTDSQINAILATRVQPSPFSLVTPGIRPLGSQSNDQQRIVTPQQAMQQGSTHLVIGRPITQAAHPNQVLKEIYQQLQEIN